MIEPTRWLSAVVPGACERLDKAYQDWARDLLGADRWRNWAASFGELGWSLSGSARAVRSVAARRARWCALGSDDLYRASWAAPAPGGWLARSLTLLDRWGLPEWTWCGAGAISYAKYMARVRSALEDVCLVSWRAAAEQHRAAFHYPALQARPSTVLRECRERDLDWEVQRGDRSWCRLRAGLVRLSGLEGRESQARFQRCVLCDAWTRNPTTHALGRCSTWQAQRAAFLEAAPGLQGQRPYVIAHAALTAKVCDPAFKVVVQWSMEIDQAATPYWNARTRT